MTENQYQACLRCLNRKRESTGRQDICNLKGKDLNFEGKCSTFDRDYDVKSDFDQKISLIRPNIRRAKYAIILIWVVLLLELISILSSYLQIGILHALNEGQYISDEALTSNDNRETYIAIIYAVVYIISIVTYIMWFRRAYYNLNIRAKCNHSEGWAAGCWFVPIISLYRPYQIMKEMWEKTDAILKTYNADYIKKSTLIVGVWWVVWIGSNIVQNIILRSSFYGETIEGFINSTWADLIVSVIGIPLALLAIFVIKDYSNREQLLFQIETNKL